MNNPSLQAAVIEHVATSKSLHADSVLLTSEWIALLEGAEIRYAISVIGTPVYQAEPTDLHVLLHTWKGEDTSDIETFMAKPCPDANSLLMQIKQQAKQWSSQNGAGNAALIRFVLDTEQWIRDVEIKIQRDRDHETRLHSDRITQQQEAADQAGASPASVVLDL